jgi:hypothetical protein
MDEHTNNYDNLDWVFMPINGKKPLLNEWNKLTKSVKPSSNQNIGIITGSVSNVCVIDIDVKDRGMEIWESIKTLIQIPQTPTVRTGSGGLHLYFQYNETLKTGSKCVIVDYGEVQKKVGIDIRNDSGQVVAPPSIHPDSNEPYTWTIDPMEVDVEPCPIDLLKLMTQKTMLQYIHGEHKYRIVPCVKPTKAQYDHAENNTFEFKNIAHIEIIVMGLAKIRADDRDDWVKVIFILGSIGKQNNVDLLPLAIQFSQQSEKYTSAEDVEEKYNARGQGLTINTLFWMLKNDNLDLFNSLVYIQKKEEQNIITDTLYAELVNSLIAPASASAGASAPAPDPAPAPLSLFNNSFDFSNSYDYTSLMDEFNDKTFLSMGDLLTSFKVKTSHSVAFITSKEGSYIKKNGDTLDVVSGLKKTNFSIRYLENNKIQKISVEEFLSLYSDKYSAIVCKLNPLSVRQKEFNIWTGFQAQRVPITNSIGLQTMLEFIKIVWANNNDEHYKYMMSWIAGLVKNIDGINEIALAMISPQGCGKNTLIDFMSFVLKERQILSTIGIGSITQKHNKAIENKRLVVINEMSSTKEDFKSNFDKMKSFITDKMISIEPKGVDSYNIQNIGNYILFTNHRDAIVVEESDRRYAIFEMSKAKINNEAYFKNIRDTCFNQEVANEFYSYLLDYDCVSLRKIPDTEIRNEMKLMSRSNALKFLAAIKESPQEIFGDETEIKATEFYNQYQIWCRDNGERNVFTSTRLGLLIKDNIVKRRSNGMFYNIETIKL